MFNKILNFLIYIIIGVCFLLFLFFQKDMSYLFVIFSSFCLLIGLCYILKKNRLGTLAFGVGVSGLITFYIYYKRYLLIYDCITFMICLTMSIILLLTFIFTLCNFVYFKKKYSILLYAEVVDIMQEKRNKKDFYLPIYSYELDGKKYTVESVQFFKRFIPDLGVRKRVYVNPEDLLDVFFPPERILVGINLIACCLFIGMSIFIIVRLFL